MMKQVFLFAFCLGLFGTASLSAQIQLPAFEFQDLKGEAFTPAQLDANKSTFIMMFDPFCDHCQKQAEWIATAADQFQDVQFVFVTLEPEIPYIEEFKEKYFGDSGLEHLFFVQDVNVGFESYFGYTDDVVNIYLYSPDKARPKYFGEETPADVLLNYL